jgi:pimeloyl-ACP methyl ester carboxylesterase
MERMNSTAIAIERELPPIYSETLGSQGPTLVLLHGWGRSLEAVRQLGELLAQNYRIVLIDLPGFGRSPLPFPASNEGGGWGTLEYSERVKQFLDDNKITECLLLGHSFGGRLSVRLASKYPDLVKGLILVGSHGLKRARPLKDEVRVRWIRAITKTAKMIDGLTGTRLFAHYLAPRFGSRDYNAAGDLRKTLVKTVNEDLTDQASTIQAPTLLLWGANDTETPLDLAQSFNRLIKDSQLHIFPNKGHEPFADVGSHLLAQYIAQFLSSRGFSAR